jgi:hypothetical protein
MAALSYLNFDLVVERTPAGYRARVPEGSTGPGTDFQLPFSELELENFVLRVGRTRRGVRRLASPEMQAAQSFGERLFDAVFAGEIRRQFQARLAEAHAQEAGIRIRLNLTAAPDLSNLPWEYLYNRRLDRFLALSVESPLVRYLDLAERIRPLTVRPPLRVLAMIASPRDYPALAVDREWSILNEALAGLQQRGLVAVERLETPTLAALQRRLRQAEYQIFHFVGHGGFDERAEDGLLLLESREGLGHRVSGRYLGILLHNHRPLRLAVLNACEGARSSRTDPFAGVAQTVVQQGIPAVIAMQFEITDGAAITFASEFYAAVADGYPVDAAMIEARNAIFAQDNDLEWATPVLYMRSPDGRIFDLEAAQARSELEAKERLQAQQDQALAELYAQALPHLQAERWDEAIALLSAIVDQQAGYQDAALRLEQASAQQQIARHYRLGLGACESQAWAVAVEHLEAVVRLDAGYRDAGARLEQARRRERLAEQYAEVRRLHRAGQWQAVLDEFERIRAIDPAYPDPEALCVSARREVAHAREQQQVAAWYSRGLRHIDDGDWEQALRAVEVVQRLDPAYPQLGALLAFVQQRLAEARTRRESQEAVSSGRDPDHLEVVEQTGPRRWGSRITSALMRTLLAVALVVLLRVAVGSFLLGETTLTSLLSTPPATAALARFTTILPATAPVLPTEGPTANPTTAAPTAEIPTAVPPTALPPTAVPPTPSPPPISSKGLLVPGRPIKGEIRQRGEQHVYRFNAAQGLLLTVTLVPTDNGSAFDPYLRLLAPNDSALAADDNSGGGRGARLVATAPQAGTYSVLVGDAQGEGAGAYILTLR